MVLEVKGDIFFHHGAAGQHVGIEESNNGISLFAQMMYLIVDL